MEKVSDLEKQLINTTKEMDLLKENLRESCAQLSTLQQQEQEREMSREQERERERERERWLKALEQQVQSLVERGLIRMERSESGSVDLNVIHEAGNAQLPQTGVCVCVVCVGYGFLSFSISCFKITYYFSSHRRDCSEKRLCE